MPDPLTIVLGITTGLILGLTGAGGSIFAVPLLMLGFGWNLPQAAPVALLAVCAAAAFGTLTAWDVTYVRYRAALLMAFTGVLTAPLGLLAAEALPAEILSLLFAGVIVLVALRMLRQAQRDPREAAVVRAAVAGDELRAHGHLCRLNPATGRIIWTRTAAMAVSAIGAVAGFLAGLLGVGGGFVIVPGLRLISELSIHSAIATSLMTIALTSAGTVAAAWLQGRELPVMIAAPFVGGALAGMLAGRYLAPRIVGPRLQQVFCALMLAVAAVLAASAAGPI